MKDENVHDDVWEVDPNNLFMTSAKQLVFEKSKDQGRILYQGKIN